MRYFKWISLLTVFALLFTALPATVAEDVAVDLESNGGESLEIGLATDDIEIPETVDEAGLPELTLDDAELDMDDLDGSLMDPDAEERAQQTEAANAVSNANSDFEIDSEGTLVRYGGFDKNVVIPDGVKKIGYGAFENDTIMESVSIPNSVTEIGSSAFWGCSSLKSIVIPNSVIEAYWGTLAMCTNLTSVQLSNKLTVLSGDFFAGCKSLKQITVPNGITEIESSAFYDSGLTSVTLPNSVTKINSSAFGYCDNLESVTIPSSVTFIDRAAFNGSYNVIIRGTAGSYAERYANGVGIPFNAPIVIIDEETDWIDDDSNDPYGIIVYANQTRTLKTIQKPTDLARTLKWSSSNTNVATVDQNGMVKGISKGTATITAATADGKGKAGQIKILVPERTSISFPEEWYEDNTVILGKTSTISAYAETPYQYDTNVKMPLTWSSSDSSIISIESTEDNEATLKGRKLGKATITATTPDGGKASIELEVIRPAVDSIKINQSGPITLKAGQTQALTATLSPAEAVATLNWGSYNTDVATVSSTGVVTAVKEGWTEVWVETDNGCYDSAEIEVLPTPPTAISLNKTKVSMGVGENILLTCTMTPAYATSDLVCSSDKPSVADVSNNYDGTLSVYAYKKGTARITVETENGKTATATITVKAAPKKVTLNKKDTVKLELGKTLQLKASLPSGTASALTWSSSNSNVATVSQNGLVSAVGKGKATITVRTFNKKKAKVKVTVSAPAPTKVSLGAKTATMRVNETLTLKATLTPANAETKLTWSSSNKKVATVDKNGKVKAKKKGTATITVKTSNKKTAKIKITVQ